MDDSTPDALRALGHQPEPVLKAIRAKCLDCSGGNKSEVLNCRVRGCALYPFRMGTNPWRAPVSEGRRESARNVAARRKNAGTIPGFGTTDGLAATTIPARGAPNEAA